MGGGLSFPVTNLHIERQNTEFFRTACVHMQGWRSSQEDAHNIISLADGFMLFGVYDGHGGHRASEYLEEKIPSAFGTVIKDLDNTEAITELMLLLDRNFLATALEDGSTCCIVLARVWDDVADAPLEKFPEVFNEETCRDKISIKILTVNIGDSRAMIVRRNGDPVSCTEDHKPTNPIERQRITNAGGHVISARVDGNLALSRAVGDAAYKNDPRLPPTEQKVIVVPEYQTHTLYYGDILLVCCDGIFEAAEMAPQNVALIVHTQAEKHARESATLHDELTAVEPAAYDPALVSRDLILESLMMNSKDNHTAIVAHFWGNDPTRDSHVAVRSLPQHEIIPGPTCLSQDPTFLAEYRKDFSRSGSSIPAFQTTIDAINNAASHSPPPEHSVLIQAYSLETGRPYEDVVQTCNPAMEAFYCPLDELTVPPIVVKTVQTPMSNADLSQSLLSLYYRTQYYTDDDENDM